MTLEPITAPAISPGTYVKLRREAQGMSIEDVGLMIGTVPGVCAHRRIQWLEAIETDAEEISLRTALVLQDVLAIDLRILAYWMAIAEGATPQFADLMRETTSGLAA